MRSALTSLTVTVAAGSVLVAGGAFSVFNDSGDASGTLTGGTVALALDGAAAKSADLVLSGPCTAEFVTGTTAAKDNLGRLNNTGCTSTFTVTNTGSLPFSIAATTVADSVVDAATAPCFTSAITGGLDGRVSPGAARVVTVRTVTGSDEPACQGQTDTVTAAVVATETFAVGRPVGECLAPKAPSHWLEIAGPPDTLGNILLKHGAGCTDTTATPRLPHTYVLPTASKTADVLCKELGLPGVWLHGGTWNFEGEICFNTV